MSTPSKRSRAVAVTVFISMVVSIAWFIGDVARSQTTPLEARSFVFRGMAGLRTFRLNPHGQTLVMLYHSECVHCGTELDEFDRQFDRLAGLDLYMLTTENSLDIDGLRRRWPRLAGSERVTWGTIDRDTRAGHFGVAVTPALFLYDQGGILVERWTGVTSIDVILSQRSGDSGVGCGVKSKRESEPCTMRSPVSAEVRPPADTSS